MRRMVGFTAVIALLWGVPARAQFEDLVKEAGRLRFVSDRPVTLLLEGATVQDAVSKLAEAAHAALACAPALATRRVNVIAREHSARQVMEGLARAAGGRWRREGNGFLLEPADPLEALRPEEAAAELHAAFLRPDLAEPYEAERRILSIFAPAQLQALAAPEGVPFTQLTPQQQQQITLLLARRSADALARAGRGQMQLAQMGAVAVRLQRQDGMVTSVAEGGAAQTRKVVFETLQVLWPGGTSVWLPLGEK